MKPKSAIVTSIPFAITAILMSALCGYVVISALQKFSGLGG